MTPETLTRLLADAGRLPRGRVAELRVEPVGTFSTEVFRVHLRCEAEAGLPPTLIVKRKLPERPERLGERFETEIRFYRDVASELPVRTPAFFGGDADAGVLLLEDLTELRATDWLRGPEEDHARAGVAALARIHAWGQDRLDRLDWVPRFSDPALLESFEDAYARGWKSHRAFFEDVVPGFTSLGTRLLGRIAESHRALAEEPSLLHGDAHAENLPLSGAGKVVVLDWAGPRLGNPGVDLGFFVAMSFPAERRAAQERELVALHAQTLRENGAAASHDPWLAYRRGVLRRVARLVGIADDWDRAELASLKMVFHRCARAALELDVAELV